MTSLRQRMLEDMQIRNLSPHTQASYCQQISQFARHFGKSPDALGPEDIRVYQVYLTNERNLAPVSILIAVAAIRFLYKITLKKNWVFEEVIPTCKKPQKLPEILGPDEVLHLLACVRSIKQRAILTTCYAAGLRVSEAIRLTAAAIDSQRMVIRVEQGKGQKDRYVMLSPKLLETLRGYWRAARPKEWLFPGDHPGRPITSSAVELACKLARRSAGITKPVTPHSLRHALAVLFILLGGMILLARGVGLAWAAPYLPGRRYYERLLYNTERKSWRELIGFGVAYGIASHSCTLPIFLGIMMLPLAAGNYWLASLAVLVYGSALAGLMLLMLILGQPAVLAMRRLTGPYLQYVVASLFLVTGGYLIHYFMVNYGFAV